MSSAALSVCVSHCAGEGSIECKWGCQAHWGLFAPCSDNLAAVDSSGAFVYVAQLALSPWHGMQLCSWMAEVAAADLIRV